MRVVITLVLAVVLGSLSGCAGGSEQGAGDEGSGGSEQTTDGPSLPDGWATSGDTTGQPAQPSPALTAAEERIPGAERAQVLVATRRVEDALDRWDAGVVACAVDTWTSCLAQPRTRLLGALLRAEGMLWRERGAPEGPCRSGVRSAYDDVYGFRLSQARGDYSDPAPGTAPSGEPDLANLQSAVDQLRPVPAALETLAATVCER
jgi:hypothetical protein